MMCDRQSGASGGASGAGCDGALTSPPFVPAAVEPAAPPLTVAKAMARMIAAKSISFSPLVELPHGRGLLKALLESAPACAKSSAHRVDVLHEAVHSY